jgi:hypothetical protein
MLIAEVVGLGFMLLPTHFAPQVSRSQLPMSSIFGVLLFVEVYIGALAVNVWWWFIFRIFRERNPSWLQASFALFSIASVGLAFWYIERVWTRDSPTFELFDFLRASHLRSGVSPLTPLIFLGLAGFALLACYCWRKAMLEDRPLPKLFEPSKVDTASFRGVTNFWMKTIECVEGSELNLPGVGALALILLVAFMYFGVTKVRQAFSIDGMLFDILFMLFGFGVYLMFSLVLLRFIHIWLALRRLLRRLYSHPSRYSYKDLQLAPRPSHLDQQKISLFEPRPGLTAIEYALARVRAILRIVAEDKTNRPRPNLVVNINQRRDLEHTLADAEKKLEKVTGENDWISTVVARTELEATMAKLTGTVTSLFEPVWRIGSPPIRISPGSDDDKITTDGLLRQQAELFVAARVGDFLRHIFPQLTNLVGFAMPAVLALVLAVSVYPFPAHDTLLWVGWTVLFATIAISLYVFIGINRNPILSMINGTDPGQFNWDSTFTMHLVLFAVLPILTLLGAQYPHVLAGTFSWIGSIFGGGASS